MHSLLSVVVVVGDDRDADAFPRFLTMLECLPPRRELVVVCFDLSDDREVEITRRINDTPDATLHFLPQAASFEVAALIGLDNSIGAQCLVVDIHDEIENLWPKLCAEADAGYDVVLTRDSVDRKDRFRPPVYGLLRSIYLTVYGVAMGLPVDPSIRGTRLLSRGAVQFLLNRRDAEMLMKSMKLASGFSATSVPTVSQMPRALKPNFSAAARKAYRSLTNSFALPVRGIIWVSFAAAAFNLLYTAYVVLAYLFSDQIAPGWTTQSLQISIGFFVFSIMFAVFGELLISIDRGVNYRLRYLVQREVRSPKSNFSRLRNVNYGSIEGVIDNLSETDDSPQSLTMGNKE